MKDYIEREDYLNDPTNDNQLEKERIKNQRRGTNAARWGFSSPEAVLTVIDTLMTCLSEEISGIWGAIDFHQREMGEAPTFLERHFSGVYLEEYQRIMHQLKQRLAFLQREVVE